MLCGLVYLYFFFLQQKKGKRVSLKSRGFEELYRGKPKAARYPQVGRKRNKKGKGGLTFEMKREDWVSDWPLRIAKSGKRLQASTHEGTALGIYQTFQTCKDTAERSLRFSHILLLGENCSEAILVSKMPNHTEEARTPLVGLPEPSQCCIDATWEESASDVTGYTKLRNAAYRGFRSLTAAFIFIHKGIFLNDRRTKS